METVNIDLLIDPEIKEIVDNIIVEEVIELAPDAIPLGDLCFKCGECDHVTFIHEIKYGLFFPVSNDTKLILKCNNCGLESTVFYAISDGIDKESK